MNHLRQKTLSKIKFKEFQVVFTVPSFENNPVKQTVNYFLVFNHQFLKRTQHCCFDRQRILLSEISMNLCRFALRIDIKWPSIPFKNIIMICLPD